MNEKNLAESFETLAETQPHVPDDINLRILARRAWEIYNCHKISSYDSIARILHVDIDSVEQLISIGHCLSKKGGPLWGLRICSIPQCPYCPREYEYNHSLELRRDNNSFLINEFVEGNMDIYDLFIMDEQSGDIIFYRGTRCLIRTKPINGKTNSIHGKYPDLKMVDNEVVVVYTEQYSTLCREKNIGKRIMLPIGEITEAKTWVWESDNLHKPTGLIAWSTVSISKEDFEYLKYKYQRFDDKKREIFLEILERLSGVSDKENIFETINVVDKIIHKEGASEPSKYLTRYEIKRAQMYAYRV